jgi:hypothetical protein
MPSRDELLQSLNKISIELGKDEVFQLLALPEAVFHMVNSSSSQQDTDIADGTGTRPYSASVAFLYFIRAYGHSLVEGPAIELGGGIGVCGLFLAKYRQEKEQQEGQQTTAKDSPNSIVVTDGEPMAAEIARRNRSLLGLSRHDVDIRRLLWSNDPKEITRQLFDNDGSIQDDDDASMSLSLKNKFRYVIGTDLLYYRTDASALMATVDTLLADDGVAFLPCIIRATYLPDQLLQAASERSLEVSKIQLERFVKEEDLECIVGWYNIQFLVVQRKGRVLTEKLREALESAGQRPFDPRELGND